jgi:hypothetical protein
MKAPENQYAVLDDQELIRLCRADDRLAFDALVNL